jgi:cytochrome c oxidase accessory protein FixG
MSVSSQAPRDIPPELDADAGPLYAARRDIRPRAVSGTYRRIKWAVLVVALAVYYFTPFIRWDRGPGAPDQAVLIDFTSRRFYFFFIEIWPQEIYVLTGLLILAALTLFLMTALAGRVWCGYMCPQTVWTDLFLTIERAIEGDDRDRARTLKVGWTAERVARLVSKHFVWLMIAWWTGGAWVLYFGDAPTMVRDLATLQAPMVAYIWIGILTFTTYVFAGLMREQVCTYMCPWPRIQAALIDEDALNVAYKADRGDPRMSVKKAEAARAAGEPAGHCIDCKQCVAVCPTGIDIRNGPQLECIQCGLCIDACDSVMAKVGYPPRLIGYDTEMNQKRRAAGEPESVRLVRPRTLLYAAAVSLVGLAIIAALVFRSETSLAVIHDRSPLFVRLTDGSIRNAYTIRIVNKADHARDFEIAVEGLPNARVSLAGGEAPTLRVERDRTLEARVLVTVPRGHRVDSTPVTFRILDKGGGRGATMRDAFRAG